MKSNLLEDVEYWNDNWDFRAASIIPDTASHENPVYCVEYHDIRVEDFYYEPDLELYIYYYSCIDCKTLYKGVMF